MVAAVPAAVGWRRPATDVPSISFVTPMNQRTIPTPRRHVVAAAARAVALLLVLLAGVDRTSADAAPTAAAAPAVAAAATTPSTRGEVPRTSRTERPPTTTAALAPAGDHDDDRRRSSPRHRRRWRHAAAASRSARACGSGCRSGPMAATLPRSSPGPRPPASPTSTCAPARAGRGSTARPFLDAILPAAHAAGLRVYGWDFPYLDNCAGPTSTGALAGDPLPHARRATASTGSCPTSRARPRARTSPTEGAVAYSSGAAPAGSAPPYPLIVCVPRPSDHAIAVFPYAAILPYYDAVAPMVYWLNRQPDSDVIGPSSGSPVRQARDPGRPGLRRRARGRASRTAARRRRSSGSSPPPSRPAPPARRSGPGSTPPRRSGRRSAPPARSPCRRSATARPGRGPRRARPAREPRLPVPVTGTWDQPTIDALRSLQIDLGATPTGELDATARAALLGPLAPPIGAR